MRLNEIIGTSVRTKERNGVGTEPWVSERRGRISRGNVRWCNKSSRRETKRIKLNSI